MPSPYQLYKQGNLLNNRYQKKNDISEGSYGLVSLAKDLRKNKLVAVKYIFRLEEETDDNSDQVTHKGEKSLQHDDDHDGGVCEEALHEISIHEKLGHHPNVIDFLDYFDSFLILEYCPRGDLYEAINSGLGPTSSKDIINVCSQLISAVEYCHSRHIYHRDIKPENILIADDWTIRLSDFGLATASRYSSEFGIGSEKYMAPELFDEECVQVYDSSKLDIWSIGICLLNMVFKKSPFTVANNTDKSFAYFACCREALFDIFSSMSNDLFAALRYSLTIDPENRDLLRMKEELSYVRSLTIDDDLRLYEEQKAKELCLSLQSPKFSPEKQRSNSDRDSKITEEEEPRDLGVKNGPVDIFAKEDGAHNKFTNDESAQGVLADDGDKQASGSSAPGISIADISESVICESVICESDSSSGELSASEDASFTSHVSSQYLQAKPIKITSRNRNRPRHGRKSFAIPTPNTHINNHFHDFKKEREQYNRKDFFTPPSVAAHYMENFEKVRKGGVYQPPHRRASSSKVGQHLSQPYYQQQQNYGYSYGHNLHSNYGHHHSSSNNSNSYYSHHGTGTTANYGMGSVMNHGTGTASYGYGHGTGSGYGNNFHGHNHNNHYGNNVPTTTWIPNYFNREKKKRGGSFSSFSGGGKYVPPNLRSSGYSYNKSSYQHNRRHVEAGDSGSDEDYGEEGLFVLDENEDDSAGRAEEQRDMDSEVARDSARDMEIEEARGVENQGSRADTSLAEDLEFEMDDLQDGLNNILIADSYSSVPSSAPSLVRSNVDVESEADKTPGSSINNCGTSLSLMIQEENNQKALKYGATTCEVESQATGKSNSKKKVEETDYLTSNVSHDNSEAQVNVSFPSEGVYIPPHHRNNGKPSISTISASLSTSTTSPISANSHGYHHSNNHNHYSSNYHHHYSGYNRNLKRKNSHSKPQSKNFSGLSSSVPYNKAVSGFSRFKYENDYYNDDADDEDEYDFEKSDLYKKFAPRVGEFSDVKAKNNGNASSLINMNMNPNAHMNNYGFQNNQKLKSGFGNIKGRYGIAQPTRELSPTAMA